MRRLTFDATPEHVTYFHLLYEAFRSRGSAAPETRVSKEEMRTDAKILRALKTVSGPIGDPPPAAAVDTRLRALKPEGGVVTLEQPEFKRLQTYVEATQWTSTATDVAVALMDWLDTAEKVESA